MKKKIQKNKLSLESIRQLIVIANSLDKSNSDISDFIDDFLISNQDEEELLLALRNEMPEDQAIEVINISKNI
jgi:hypothetical protein